MSELPRPRVAIVDYQVGNLFSVRHACSAVGLDAVITGDKRDLLAADAVIVPGVGAFGDAMGTLRRLDFVRVLQDIAASGTMLVGICLGMQLFMTESEEFGMHKGLGLFEGPVVRFNGPRGAGGELKVPQVGWNRIRAPHAERWAGTPLAGTAEGEFMYFVHSYYAKPADPSVVWTITRYGDVEFCSGMQRGNVLACQFHPERSGAEGLKIYRNIAREITRRGAATGKNYVR